MLDVVSPFDLTVIDSLPQHSQRDAQQMLEKARAVFNDRAQWLPPHERVSILRKLAILVENESEAFAQLIAKEGGKPLMDARLEVTRAIGGIELAANSLMHVMKGEEVPMGYSAASVGRQAHTHYEPSGVVLAISAFNHPLNLIVHQVTPAIAVGCPVIVKPASATPLCCKRFVELVHEAGLPEVWCQFCLCENEVSQKMAASDHISFLSFIGSEKVGWELKKNLAYSVHCALEHGGVAPVIVDKSADIEMAIPALTKGGFYHAGQVCVSVQRVFVHASILDDVVAQLKRAADALIVGDPCDETTEVGPLIHPKEVTRAHEWVEEAIEQGAELITGGKVLSETTYAPTILLRPPKEAKVSVSEMFAPVICVYSYDAIEDAVFHANNVDYAFQSAVFTEDVSVANYCSRNLEAVTVLINDHTAFRVDWMPFGGYRRSGYGLGGIESSMRDMMRTKLVITKYA